MGQNYNFVKNIEFEEKSQFLIGYGDKSIFVWDFMNKKRPIIISLEKNRDIEYVVTANIYPLIECDYKLMIGYKRKNFNQVCIIDFYSDRSRNGNAELPNSKIFNFTQALSDQKKIKIHKNQRQIILCDHKEIVMLEEVHKDFWQ